MTRPALSVLMPEKTPTDGRTGPPTRSWPLPIALPTSVALAALIVLAAVVRLVGLAAVPLQGDEYRSLSEASSRFGVNLTSLLYDAILRAFMVAGNGVEVLRLPAVIFGVGAVVAIYALASVLTDRRTAIVAALLLALSSYAIGYSQDVRFYSLFLFAALLALQSMAMVLRDGPRTDRIVWLVVANLLCLAAHGLGILVIVGEVVGFYIYTAPHGKVRARLAIASGVLVVGILILTRPRVERALTAFLNRYQDSQLSYSTAHGLHLTSVVKIAWTFFVFTFGERVYPLWLWLTVPGTILIAVLVLAGLRAQRHNRLLLSVVLPQLILGPVLLYLVLDAVTASQFTGASPRYLIPLLGPFLILVAAGITSWRRPLVFGVTLFLVVALNAATLRAYGQNAWNYNGYSADWPRVATLIDSAAGAGSTVVLVDGRSADPAAYYFKSAESRHHARQAALDASGAQSALGARRVVVVADTDRPSDQVAVNTALAILQRHYRVTTGLVEYPLFAYVLAPIPHSWHLSGSGWSPIPLPLSVYDSSLADLHLPARLVLAGRSVQTYGAATLPSTAGSRLLSLPLPHGRPSHISLAISLQNDGQIASGQPVASITLEGAKGRLVRELRKGRQIDDWKRLGARRRPADAQYTVGYRWLKLVSLQGKKTYPEAYSQFRTGIGIIDLPIPARAYSGLTIRYLPPKGTLRLWFVGIR